MAAIESEGIGQVEYSPEEVYWFEGGIPAFEHLRRWLLVERAMFQPLAVLQSVDQPDLRFACLPVSLLRADYQVDLGPYERKTLEWECEGGDGRAPARPSLICLAIVTFRAGQSATANLLAPILLNPQARRGAQVVQAGTQYSTEFELARQEDSAEGPPACS
jgi:flagellar assembly factor FliW